MQTHMHTVTVNLLQLVFGGMLCFAVGGLVTYQAVKATAECSVTTSSPLSDEPMRRFMEAPSPPMDQGKRY